MAMVPPRLEIRSRAIIAEVAAAINATELEALAARAWPAAESERVDGWLLRRTPAVQRRRSNSALPIGRDGASIETVERFYRGHGMTPLVQLAPAEELVALDTELAAHGWRADGATDILVARDVPVSATAGVDVTVRDSVDRAWLEAWVAAEGRSDAEETYAHVLRLIPSPAGFAIAHVEGRAAGVGIAVCKSGWSGVFCMATDPAVRRRGVARAVLASLAAWSRERGAWRIYLQVECDNRAARALYAALGFERSHGYHFRVAP
jgi:ribosomal protein S18 acetylase RimI-like enzyme